MLEHGVEHGPEHTQDLSISCSTLSTISCSRCFITSPEFELSVKTRLEHETVLKSQVVYSKQPKLGLTQEFVVDCAHALWVIRSIKRLV